MVNILENLNSLFKLELGQKYETQIGEVDTLQSMAHFNIPKDYLDLMDDDIQKTFYSDKHGLIEIHSVSSAIDLNKEYHVQEDCLNSIAIGNSFGTYLYLLFDGNNGVGIYGVPIDDVCEEETFFISKSLTNLLVYGEGIDKLKL